MLSVVLLTGQKTDLVQQMSSILLYADNDLELLVQCFFGSFSLVHKSVWGEWSQEIIGVFNIACVIDCGRSCQQTAGSWPLSLSPVENLH